MNPKKKKAPVPEAKTIEKRRAETRGHEVAAFEPLGDATGPASDAELETDHADERPDET